MATKASSTVKEKLEELHALQVIDSKKDQFQILKGQLPIEVSDLEDEIKGLETRLTRLEEQVADQLEEENKHKENIINSNTLIEKYNKQLDDVKNNREFEALTKEIELQQLENKLSEKRIKEAQISVEQKKEMLENTIGRLDSKKKDLEEKKIELDKIVEKTEKEETKLGKAAERTRKKIEPRLLKAYDKIRARYKNGLAVVTIRRSACGGCYNRVPPQIQIELGLYKNIITCEHCGRVIVDNEIGGYPPEPKEKDKPKKTRRAKAKAE